MLAYSISYSIFKLDFYCLSYFSKSLTSILKKYFSTNDIKSGINTSNRSDYEFYIKIITKLFGVFFMKNLLQHFKLK